MSARSPLAVECRFDTRDAVPSPRLLRRWASAALGARGAGRELALSTVGATRMRTLNRRYRGKDKPTNVLLFPPSRTRLSRGADPRPLGDVVICPAVLRREAREQGKAERAHWAHLVVHGTLHLAGYDHEVRDRRPPHGAARDRGAAHPGLRQSLSAGHGARSATMSDTGARKKVMRRIRRMAAPKDRAQLAEMLRDSATGGLIDADALSMLEGVLEVAGPAGARHHVAAQPDDLRAQRCRSPARSCRSPSIPATRVSRCRTPTARRSWASCWPRTC